MKQACVPDTLNPEFGYQQTPTLELFHIQKQAKAGRTATSRRGSSQNFLRMRSARLSDHCAGWSEGPAETTLVSSSRAPHTANNVF